MTLDGNSNPHKKIKRPRKVLIYYQSKVGCHKLKYVLPSLEQPLEK